MNHQQRTAIENPVRLGLEVQLPRYGRHGRRGTHTEILTLNSGFESLEAGIGGPVWHASAASQVDDFDVLEDHARRMLTRVGDAGLGPVDPAEGAGPDAHLPPAATGVGDRGEAHRSGAGHPRYRGDVPRLQMVPMYTGAPLRQLVDMEARERHRRSSRGSNRWTEEGRCY